MFTSVLILIAKLSLVTALPIATIVVWQKRTNAHWATLFFCLVAIAVNYVAQLLLEPRVYEFSNHDAFVPIFVFLAFYSNATIYLPWLLDAFIFGLIREGGRWLILRYATKKVRLWQDGVLFGIGYSHLALLLKIEFHFSNYSPSHWNTIKHSLVEIVNWLNSTYHPFAAWYYPLIWITTLLFFNVCTSVLVLASVQQRKIRYLLIAIAVYAVYAYAPRVTPGIFYHLNMNWLGPVYSSEVIKELTRFFVPLPFFWLVFRLRKTMSEVDHEQQGKHTPP